MSVTKKVIIKTRTRSKNNKFPKKLLRYNYFKLINNKLLKLITLKKILSSKYFNYN